MGVYFKQNDFFVDYCKVEGSGLLKPLDRSMDGLMRIVASVILGAQKGDQLNCNERDELFNSIFTTASITFGVGAFCFGLLSDRFGIFVGRLTSFSFVSIGLTVLILILKQIIPEVRIFIDHYHSFWTLRTVRYARQVSLDRPLWAVDF